MLVPFKSPISKYCLLVVAHCLKQLQRHRFLLWCKVYPTIKQLLKIWCQFHHVPVGEELGERYSHSSTDGLQGWNWRHCVPFENICNCWFGEATIFSQSVFCPTSFPHQTTEPFENFHKTTFLLSLFYRSSEKFYTAHLSCKYDYVKWYFVTWTTLKEEWPYNLRTALFETSWGCHFNDLPLF